MRVEGGFWGAKVFFQGGGGHMVLRRMKGDQSLPMEYIGRSLGN